jgi:hypothetical protein
MKKKTDYKKEIRRICYTFFKSPPLRSAGPLRKKLKRLWLNKICSANKKREGLRTTKFPFCLF